MKLDTSSYYPTPHLDDDDNPYMPGHSDSGMPEKDPAVEPALESADEASCEVKAAGIVTETDDSYPDLPPTAAESAITNISNWLSWIFVPLLMPVYAAVLAFGLSVLNFTGLGTRIVFTLIILAFNVAIPALLIFFLKKLGFVHDIGLNERNERFIPYVICILCLIGTAIFLSFKSAPQWFVMFYLGGAAAGIVEVIINRWWKISVHAAGISGIVALLTYLLAHDFTMPGARTWLIIAIVIAGLLGSARVWLGRHTVWQVLAGYAVGFAAVYIMMLFSPSSPAIL